MHNSIWSEFLVPIFLPSSNPCFDHEFDGIVRDMKLIDLSGHKSKFNSTFDLFHLFPLDIIVFLLLQYTFDVREGFVICEDSSDMRMW